MSESFDTFPPPENPPQKPASRPIAKIAAALAKAQGQIVPPTKNRKVDFQDKNGRRVHYNYADLADVIECCKKPLADNELAITHRMENLHGFGLVTQLIHSSGEYISTWYPLPDPTDVAPQQFGSALTYARRYSVSALLGIASEEDDDGQSATGPKKPEEPKQSEQPKPKPKLTLPEEKSPFEEDQHDAWEMTDAQRKLLFATATEHGWSHEQMKLYLQARWGFDSTKMLSRNQFDALIDVMVRGTYEKACSMIPFARKV